MASKLLGDLCTALDPNAINLGAVPIVFDELVRIGKLIGGAVVRMTAR